MRVNICANLWNCYNSITYFHYFLIYRYPASLFLLDKMYTKFVAYITPLQSSLTTRRMTNVDRDALPGLQFQQLTVSFHCLSIDPVLFLI